MFNRGTRVALRYAISRTHLVEKHVNALYVFLKTRHPGEGEFLDDLVHDWQEEVGRMHQAFLQGDTGYFDEYESRYP